MRSLFGSLLVLVSCSSIGHVLIDAGRALSPDASAQLDVGVAAPRATELQTAARVEDDACAKLQRPMRLM